MELALVLGVYLSLIVFLVYVCVLSEPGTDTIGGRLNILLTEDLPGAATKALERVLPGRLFRCLSGAYDYVVNQRNPLLQLLYLVLYVGSFAVYLWHGWSRLADRDILISNVLVACCLYSFKVACGVSPGRIDKDSWRRFDNYAHDPAIYEAGKECPTCKVPKLARSKHCRLCGFCVARFDHHCGWLNQCVGEENYRHFLVFLALHATSFFYGSSRMAGIFRREIEARQLLKATFYSPRTGQTVQGSPTVVVQYLFVHEGPLCGVMALCSVMAVVITAFFLYHVHLLVRNTTTNETFKWAVAKARVQRSRDKAQRAREMTGGNLPPAEEMPDPVNSYRLAPWYANVQEVLRPRSQQQQGRPGPGGEQGKKDK